MKSFGVGRVNFIEEPLPDVHTPIDDPATVHIKITLDSVSSQKKHEVERRMWRNAGEELAVWGVI